MLASLALQNGNNYIFYYLVAKINTSLHNIYKYCFTIFPQICESYRYPPFSTITYYHSHHCYN